MTMFSKHVGDHDPSAPPGYAYGPSGKHTS